MPLCQCVVSVFALAYAILVRQWRGKGLGSLPIGARACLCRACVLMVRGIGRGAHGRASYRAFKMRLAYWPLCPALIVGLCPIIVRPVGMR